MSAGLLTIADLARVAAAGTDGPTIPVLATRGAGSERLAPGRPVILSVNRDRDGTTGALDGTIAVYGALLPHPYGPNANAQVMKGEDGATGRTVFTTGLTYAAFSNNNWIVLVNDTVIQQGSGAGKFTVSNSSGVAVITFGTALNVNDRVEIYSVTPTQLLADGAHGMERTGITGKTVLWVLKTHATGALSRTLVTITPEAD